MKVVLVTPNEADQALSVGFLRDEGIEVEAFPGMSDLATRVGPGVGCIVLVEEALAAPELRNPRAPIRNAVYLLGTLDNTDPTFMKCHAMIDKQARHITRLVDDLLDASRLELGKVELRLQRVDLNEAVTSAVEACLPIT